MTFVPKNLSDVSLAVVGLGYVGLPLATAFGSQYRTIGFDVDASRIAELQEGHDRTLEVSSQDLARADQLTLTSDLKDIKDCDIYIVTVPTPVRDDKTPDLSLILSASRMIGGLLSKGNIVIYESTVYPGCTEDDCVPILAAESGLAYNQDFYCGYSPERINPGDKQHRLADIIKVTSGSTADVADYIDHLYQQIITAGTHKAPSIAVAEAAKVIENTQRDVNIALINELAQIFGKMGIDTESVLQAAGTKWNFLPFRPGLVGGHCIGVDPYYLTHKAQQIGYQPEIILAGRALNDGMGQYVADRLAAALEQKGKQVTNARIIIFGITFKENCPDIRNTKVVDVINALIEKGCQIDVHDPWADKQEVLTTYGINLVEDLEQHAYDAAVVAVAHDEYKQSPQLITASMSDEATIYDLKHVLGIDNADLRL